MAKKQNYLKRKQTFSGAQVLLFGLIFAAVGAVAIWQSLVEPHNKGASGACAYSAVGSGGVVSASGLPTGVVVNFLSRDNITGSKSDWVLGITNDGNWNVNVPAPAHTTTYDFVSKTWGKDGSKYNVYAECTQSI
jgi:hypothetical protein